MHHNSLKNSSMVIYSRKLLMQKCLQTVHKQIAPSNINHCEIKKIKWYRLTADWWILWERGWQGRGWGRGERNDGEDEKDVTVTQLSQDEQVVSCYSNHQIHDCCCYRAEKPLVNNHEDQGNNWMESISNNYSVNTLITSAQFSYCQ